MNLDSKMSMPGVVAIGVLLSSRGGTRDTTCTCIVWPSLAFKLLLPFDFLFSLPVLLLESLY